MNIDNIEQEFNAQDVEQEFEQEFDVQSDMAGADKPLLIPTLTQDARARLQYLQQQAPEKRLRISVKAGGCSGYQYEFLLEDYQQSSDSASDDLQQYADKNIGVAVELLIDKISLGFLQQAMIDYQTNLAGENFSIINPSATSSCGCGVSFAM